MQTGAVRSAPALSVTPLCSIHFRDWRSIADSRNQYLRLVYHFDIQILLFLRLLRILRSYLYPHIINSARFFIIFCTFFCIFNSIFVITLHFACIIIRAFKTTISIFFFLTFCFTSHICSFLSKNQIP